MVQGPARPVPARYDSDVVIAEMIVLTNTALERARALHPPLALQSDSAARTALAALVAAGAREQCADHRDGSEQQLVALGPADAAWGYAIVKGSLAVTVVDPDGRRYLLARSQRPATPPRLKRLAPEPGGELSRYSVVGVPAISGIAVDADGTVRLLGERGEPLR